MGKKILIFLVVAAIAFGVWYKFIRIDKTKAINIIVTAKDGRVASSFASFDEGFLISWARAIKRSSPDFSYNGKNYSSDTGKAK